MINLDDAISGQRGQPYGDPVPGVRRDKMTGTLEQISGLLHEAGETLVRGYVTWTTTRRWR